MMKAGLLLIILFAMGAGIERKMKITYPLNTGKSGLEMINVKGGTFIMGGKDDAIDGGPDGVANSDECPHLVTLKDFSIGKYEVSQADWFEIMCTRPGYFRDCSDCPVEQVSWDDVKIFISKLNTLKPDDNYRLPTEEEWEFAGRGGLKSRNFRYSGSNNANDVAWWSRNSGNKPHPVGSLKPNELGIYDMSGNIWEWCEDFKIPYPCDPGGKKFESRVLRGGTWTNDSSSVRTKDRNGRGAQLRLNTLGFRLAK